jgi:glycine/D-amino acid oxidase-like deaminating enzyme
MPSLWLDPLPSPRPTPAGTHHCDVLVIGGGLTGTSAAWHLAKAGISVILVEKRQLAMSASGRNAGFLLQGTAERYDRAVAIMGREKARAVHAFTLENHRLMREFVEEHQIDCGYQKRGSLQLGDTPEEEESLIISAKLLQEDGFSAEVLSKNKLPPVFQQSYHVGIHLKEDGELNPAHFVRAVAQAAEQLGARIFEQSPVLRLEASSPGDVVAVLSGGEIQAGLAVVATNARAEELVPSLAGIISPVRGQMLSTAPLPPLFPCPVYANHGYDYWRQDETGKIALGGWRNLDPGIEVGHDEVLHPEIQSRMEQFLKRFAPGLKIERRWSGIMGFSRDGLPLIGPARGLPGALVGAGFTGHGFGFAFLAGKALAGIIQEGSHPFSDLLDSRRFAV